MRESGKIISRTAKVSKPKKMARSTLGNSTMAENKGMESTGGPIRPCTKVIGTTIQLMVTALLN